VGGGEEDRELCVRIGDVGCGMWMWVWESLGGRWGMVCMYGEERVCFAFWGGGGGGEGSLAIFWAFLFGGAVVGGGSYGMSSCCSPPWNTTSTYTSLLPPSQGAPHLSHNLHQLSNHLLHILQNQCARPPAPVANPHTAQPPLLLSQHPQHRRHNPRPTAPKRMP